MRRSCSGSVDKNPPKEIMWKTVPRRLFFGRHHSFTWGPGGVAFLHPESNIQDKAYMRLYKITYVFDCLENFFAYFTCHHCDDQKDGNCD